MKKPDKVIVQDDGRIRYEKEFERKIGQNNQKRLRIVVDPKKNKRITSFPE